MCLIMQTYNGQYVSPRFPPKSANPFFQVPALGSLCRRCTIAAAGGTPLLLLLLLLLLLARRVSAVCALRSTREAVTFGQKLEEVIGVI